MQEVSERISIGLVFAWLDFLGVPIRKGHINHRRISFILSSNTAKFENHALLRKIVLLCWKKVVSSKLLILSTMRLLPKSQIIFLFSLLLKLSTGFAQPNLQHIEYLTTNDGLNSNFVSDIFQDSIGFLWFATMNGLDRYDGSGFDHLLRDKDVSSHDGNFTTQIIALDSHRLAVATNNGILVVDIRSLNYKRILLSDSLTPK